MDSDLKTACEAIHAQGGVRWTDYSPLLPFDSRLVVAYHVKHYSKNWVYSVMRGAKWLWETWTTDDWLFEMSTACPRVTHNHPILDLDAFSDLVFLAQYLRLDGFRVFVEHADASHAEKADAILRLRQHFPLIKYFEDPSDEAEDPYTNTLNAVRARLIDEGVFRSFNTATEDSYPYIESLEELLTNI